MIIFRELISFLEPVIPDCILDNLLSVENKKYVIIWVAYDIYCFIESYSDFKYLLLKTHAIKHNIMLHVTVPCKLSVVIIIISIQVMLI